MQLALRASLSSSSLGNLFDRFKFHVWDLHSQNLYRWSIGLHELQAQMQLSIWYLYLDTHRHLKTEHVQGRNSNFSHKISLSSLTQTCHALLFTPICCSTLDRVRTLGIIFKYLPLSTLNPLANPVVSNIEIT